MLLEARSVHHEQIIEPVGRANRANGLLEDVSQINMLGPSTPIQFL